MATDFRHEYKYLCTAGEKAVLKAKLSAMMKPDSHTLGGSYLVRSLYFDDSRNSCFFDNEDGSDPRYKYRMRAYNCDDGFIVLERKMKIRSKTSKMSARITKAQAQMLIDGKIPDPDSSCSEILSSMLTDMKRKDMRPAVIVQYERIPFVERVGNVRITLDTYISSSQSFSDFFKKDIPRRMILPDNKCLLEVKWDTLLPSYIYKTLNTDNLQWCTFSKYYLCRKFNLGGYSL